MITEADALNHICPNAINYPCQASRCMAWRWMPEAGGSFYIAKED